MKKLKQMYDKFCAEPSDINEHLPVLYTAATKCESVLETGVRGGVSTWALAYGLANNGKSEKYLFINDIEICQVSEILDAGISADIKIEYEWKNNLQLDFNRSFDMAFIDTWHVYGQLKRELNCFSPFIKKYIIMHDTTIDEHVGETIRNGWDPKEQSIKSGIPEEEITKGVWPAVEEFLEKNPSWKLHARFTNNNGLTILKRTT